MFCIAWDQVAPTVLPFFHESARHYSLSISSCMNAPGMSIVATSPFYIESMMHESTSASKATVGACASTFLVCGHFLCPPMQMWPPIIPFRLFFRNIWYSRASDFSVLLILSALHGLMTCISCNCCSSSVTAFVPASPNTLMPLSNKYCVIAISSKWYGDESSYFRFLGPKLQCDVLIP